MRGRHTCGLCPRRGRVPVGVCEDCRRAYCERHGGWDGDRWVCNGCAPAGAQLIRATAGG